MKEIVTKLYFDTGSGFNIALYQKNNAFIFTVKDPQIDLNIFHKKIKKDIFFIVKIYY